VSFNSTTTWHFDHTTAVGGGEFDLYSVALHEIVHTLGFGNGVSWDANHSGTTWTGTNGVAANGGTGTAFMDAQAQTAVMTPSISAGTRRYLTDLDVAMLEDIGFSVLAIPEPSTFAFSYVAFGAGLVVWMRRSRARQA
jgi:hypothetical protein